MEPRVFYLILTKWNIKEIIEKKSGKMCKTVGYDNLFFPVISLGACKSWKIIEWKKNKKTLSSVTLNKPQNKQRNEQTQT